MKSIIKILIGLAVVIGLITFINNYNKDISAPTDAEKQEIKDFSSKDFSQMTIEEKDRALKLFKAGEIEPYKSQKSKAERDITKLFKSKVKFPKTLEFVNPLGGYIGFTSFVGESQVIERLKGQFLAQGEYRAENKLSQKVKGRYTVKYTYDGKGIKDLELSLE